MAQVRLARVIPSMHVHLCVALWLISPRLSPSSTSFHRSPSSPSRCSPQCSTRSLGPTPCATSAWGPWPLLTTRHPSQKLDSTEDVFVVKGETSRSHEINEKGFHGGLCSSDRSGKLDNLSENTRVEQTHDGSGQPDERNSSSAHTVEEQFAPEEIVTLRCSTRTTSSTVQSTRRTSTSTFQDYHILQ